MRYLPPIIAGLWALIAATVQPASAQVEASPIYIEDSPDADDLVKQAQVLREQQRLTEAAAMYQKVAQDYSRKLMKVEGDVHTDGVRWVRLMVAADRDLLAAYRALHEPMAARLVEEACKPAPKLAELESAAQRFSLCASGLEAALRAAAMYLERAQPADAANLLDDFADHADLPAQMGRWRLLQAAAAVYNRDEARLQEQRAGLGDLKDLAALKQIDELVSQLHAPSTGAALSAIDTLPKVTVPAPLGKPLYVREVQTDAETPRGPSTDPTRALAGPWEHHMIPTVAGDVVYLNTGTTLRAVDRSSLSDVWTTPVSPGVTDGTAYERANMLREQSVRDQRGVLVHGESVAAVMGRSLSTGRGYVLSSAPDTFLVSANRADGKLLWRRTPEQLDPSLTPSFFHGTPVGGDGRAYVMVRRTQNSGFRDAFVLAVDLRTGELAWKRHISSTTLGYASRGFTQMLADRGRLYIADNLGAVACLDGRTGAVRWFHKVTKFKTITTGRSAVPPAPWRMSPPVLVEAGLIVPPFVSDTAAMLFHPATGKKLRDLDGEAFSASAYLTEANGDVLSLGPKITLLDGETLKAKWSHPLGGSGAMTGRAAVTEDRVLIPTNNRLYVLDLASGRKLSESPLEATGNLLALEGQLLITSGSVVRSYMTWPVVYENLTARIRKDPTDARAGLALAHAAMASNRAEEALEGIDHVVAVLRHRSITRPADVSPESDTVHADVFQQLLRLSDAEVTADADLRAQVFDRIAKATVTPSDEAQYHLLFAAHLVETDWPQAAQLDRRRDAMRHLQTVLESPVMSAQLVPRAGGWQQAGVEARMKAAAMIDRFSRSVYEEFDDRAAEELDRLLAGGNADPAQLVELSRRFPLAKAAGAAMLAAGEALSKSGRFAEAATQLRRAYREKAATPLRPRIIGRLVELYVRTGKPLRARQWLQRAQRENIEPLRDGQAVAARTWLAEIGSQPLGADALPDLGGKLGKPTTLAGTLLLPRAQPREYWPLDRALIANNETIELRGGPRLERIWEARIEPGAELMWLNDAAAIFWIEASHTIVALDARSGKLLWPHIKAKALLSEMAPRLQAQPGEPGIAPRGRIVLRNGVVLEINDDQPLLFPGPDPFRPVSAGRLSVHGQLVPSEPWFAERAVRLIINDAIICVADAGGRVVGVDMDSGQVKWRYACPFDRIDQMAISGECVAIAGAMKARIEEGIEASTIVALDALTGDVIAQVAATGRLVWLGLSEADALIYINEPADRRTKSRLIMHQLSDGEEQWSADLTTGRIDAAAMAGEAIVLLIDGSDLIVIDPLTRKVHDPVTTAMIERLDAIDIAVAGEAWHVLTPQQGAALRGDTSVLWRDAIEDDAGARMIQLLGRRHMLMVTFDGDQPLFPPLPPPPRRLPDPRLEDQFSVKYRLFLLDRQGGAIVQEAVMPLPARLDPQQAVLLHHHVLLGAGTKTVVIPDAAE